MTPADESVPSAHSEEELLAMLLLYRTVVVVPYQCRQLFEAIPVAMTIIKTD